jgi:hypothetical protein
MNQRKAELSLSERRYLENEEFNKQNVEQVAVKKNRAAEHRKAFGYSLTFAKLMKKWNCTTADEWRALRKKHKKENYIGETKPKVVKEDNAPVKTYNKHKKR